MSVELAVHRAIRARLVASEAVTTLVRADSILDTHRRPAPRPGIIMGEDQARRESSIDRRREKVTHVLHVWTEEPSTENCKRITGAVRSAITAKRLDLGLDYHCVDHDVTMMRHLRDPDGITAHGVVTVEILTERLAQ